MTYQIEDSYQRFNQKNNMLCRIFWDPAITPLKEVRNENQLKQIARGLNGFSLEDYSLANAAGIIGIGMNRPGTGLRSWKPLPSNSSLTFPEDKTPQTDPDKITRHIKNVARYFGADLVGIANLDRRWVYSNHYLAEEKENPAVEIDGDYRWAICMGLEMDYTMMRTAPSAVHMAETLLAYSRLSFLVGTVAEFIRKLGYRAIPSLNDTALNVPLAVDAGLGQMGRHGLMISKKFGPRQRLCKVITDLPLNADSPVDFGVTEFCAACGKCARLCPVGAISEGERSFEGYNISNNPGVLKWHLNAEKCYRQFANVGTNCGICIRTCPFNKSANPVHGAIRSLVKNAPWLDGWLAKMDDWSGYGKYLKPEFFWR